MAPAALLALAAAAAPADAASSRALALFREACLRGQVGLGEYGGVEIKRSTAPRHVRGHFNFGSRLADTKFVKISDPPATYLVSTRFTKQETRRQSQCAVISESLILSDALEEIARDDPDGRVIQKYSPDMYAPQWDIEVPEKGYAKRVRNWKAKWVEIEVFRYLQSKSN